MRNESRGDVWKVWWYAAASVALGAWISPLLYNAGKALAEVSSSKTTNGPIEWLAGVCRAADFPRFYGAALLGAATLLFFPWMEWVHAKRGDASGRPGPWRIRLPERARMTERGQPLRENPRGLWHACAGFLIVAGLLLSMGVALVPTGFFTLRPPEDGIGLLAVRVLGEAVLVAAVTEVFFRGVAMGIFLRAMRPSAALAMSAAFFALVFSVAPLAGLNVADPEAAGTGFAMLARAAARFSDWRSLGGNFAPLLALGGVLAYARWRTASLWLPVGLHTGWIFAREMLAALSVPSGSPVAGAAGMLGSLLQQGVVPLISIVIAGVLAHHLTADHHDDPAVVR